jgi:hypothetical protein
MLWNTGPQKVVSKSFSPVEFALLEARGDFADAISHVKNFDDAEAVVLFGSRLLDDRSRLADVDYTQVRMISIVGLSVNVLLQNYSSRNCSYVSETELNRDLELWTKGDRLKFREQEGLEQQARF